MYTESVWSVCVCVRESYLDTKSQMFVAAHESPPCAVYLQYIYQCEKVEMTAKPRATCTAQ